MRRQHLFSLGLAIFSLITSSTARQAPYECVSGINYALYLFSFASDSNSSVAETDYYAKTCQNTLLTTSMWAAAQLYCTPKQIIAGQEYLNTTSCELYGLMPIVGYDEVKNNLTDEFIASLQVVDYEDITNDALVVFNTSILLSTELANIGIKTVATWDNMMSNHKNLGWANYGFWGLILLAGIFHRLISHFSPTTSLSMDIESTSNKRPIGSIHQTFDWIRTNLIIPATFGTYRQRLFYWCTVTTRLETLIIILYYILNIICSSVGYSVFSPNLYYTTRLQAWRYFSDRTGILAYSNLPLLWMFSGRNNIFIWATGWSFSRFNIFHRHIARVAVVEAIAHSVGYTVEVFLDGGKEEYYESWLENYWYMGAIATIAMSLLLGTSSIFLRLKRYEVFLVLHIVLSILTIVALFYHTHVFTDHSWDPYLWPLVGIWVFDRLTRIFRQVYINVHVSSSGLKRTTGTANYDADADLITLIVKPAGKMLNPGNGQHYFVYQYLRWRGWENHPFSLASWTSSSPSALTTPTASPTVIHEIPDKETTVVMRASSSENSIDSPTSVSNTSTSTPASATTLTFYIRPIKGFTARLKKECLTYPSTPLNLQLILEGPYGHHFVAERYQTLILIAGGTGIAGVLPLLRRPNPHTPNHNNQNIKLLWSSKHAATLTSIIARERGGEFDMLREGVSLDLHVTREDGNGSGKGREDVGLVIKKGRPNIREAVREEVLNAIGGGKVAVVVCGPPGMADEGRDAVHSLLKEGVSEVEFVEESFGW